MIESSPNCSELVQLHQHQTCYQVWYNYQPRTPVEVDGKKVYIPAVIHSPEFWETAEPDESNELEFFDNMFYPLRIRNILYDPKHLPTVLDHCRRDTQRYDRVQVCRKCPKRFTNSYGYLLHIKLKYINQPQPIHERNPDKLGEGDRDGDWQLVKISNRLVWRKIPL